MKYLARLCVCALTAVVLFVGASRVIGSWMGREMSLLQLSRWVVFESRRTEALHERADAILRSLEIKKAVIAEVFDGRLTLRESARYFKEANEYIENGDVELVADYFVPLDEEAQCEQVLAWVWGEAAYRSDAATKETVRRLEHEFQAMFGKPCYDLNSPEDYKPDEADPLNPESSAPLIAG
jgi:hypothetical protein